MATYTKKLKLEKPALDEFYDIEVINANMDKIDDAMDTSTQDYVTLDTAQTITGAKTFSSNVTFPSMTLNGHKITAIKSLSNNGDLGWTTTAAGQATLVDESCLAFWNGAHAGSSSNLAYSKYGTIMGLSSAQTVTGVKTFNALPESSVAPTKDTQLVNKKYVDDLFQSYTPVDLTKYEKITMNILGKEE